MNGTDIKMKVRVSLGKTINIGDCESLRIDIAVEDEFIDRTYQGACDAVFNVVSGELDKRINEVRKRFI